MLRRHQRLLYLIMESTFLQPFDKVEQRELVKIQLKQVGGFVGVMLCLGFQSKAFSCNYDFHDNYMCEEKKLICKLIP